MLLKIRKAVLIEEKWGGIRTFWKFFFCLNDHSLVELSRSLEINLLHFNWSTFWNQVLSSLVFIVFKHLWFKKILPVVMSCEVKDTFILFRLFFIVHGAPDVSTLFYSFNSLETFLSINISSLRMFNINTVNCSGLLIFLSYDIS